MQLAQFLPVKVFVALAVLAVVLGALLILAAAGPALGCRTFCRAFVAVLCLGFGLVAVVLTAGDAAPLFALLGYVLASALGWEDEARPGATEEAVGPPPEEKPAPPVPGAFTDRPPWKR
jgi:hypothetical protein